MLLRHRTVHLPRNSPVAEVTSHPGPQFGDIKRLRKIHLEHPPASRGQRQTVLRRLDSLRHPAVAELVIGSVSSPNSRRISAIKLRLSKRGLPRTNRGLIPMHIRVRLQQLHTPPLPVQSAKPANLHQNVEPKTMPRTESPQQLIIPAPMLRPH